MMIDCGGVPTEGQAVLLGSGSVIQLTANSVGADITAGGTVSFNIGNQQYAASGGAYNVLVNAAGTFTINAAYVFMLFGCGGLAVWRFGG